MANKRDKLTHLMKKAAPYIAAVSGDVNDETVIKDLEAVLMALETHKLSADHDAINHVWSGIQQFLLTMLTASIVPSAADTYDVGSDTYRYRKGFFSELSSLVFNRENIVILDGQFLVTKMAGSLPSAILYGQDIDFGRTMYIGDFVLFRGEGQVEYMKITGHRGDTTYRVTRNLDGSGANAWPEGAPFAVLGSAGDGWLELNAIDRKRFSVWVQGTNYNNSVEIGRYGDITGWQNAPFIGNGIALGNYAADKYLVYTSPAGMRVKGGTIEGSEIIAGGGNIHLDEDGMTFLAHTEYQPLSSWRFIDPISQDLVASFYGLKQSGLSHGALSVYDPASANLRLIAVGAGGLEGRASIIDLDSGPGNSKITLEAPDGIIAHDPITLPAAAPTLSGHAASKKYVDDAVGGVWKDWLPSFVGWTTGSPAGTFRYTVVGKTCMVSIDMTAGTSNNTAARISLPVTAKSGGAFGGANGMAMNNGVVLSAASKWYIDSALSGWIQFGTDMGTEAFTASGTKRVRCLAIFEVE